LLALTPSAAPFAACDSYPCLGAQFSKDGALIATWQGDGARRRRAAQGANAGRPRALA
jgi:hypothetical protein